MLDPARLKPRTKGFTLLEISIVLTIVGLIAGGVVLGRHLIKVAEIRAGISQIQQYQTNLNIFRQKYNVLPGDMHAQAAAAMGFQPRGLYDGQGDGNGIIMGSWVNSSGGSCNVSQEAGETVMYWVDMTTAKLIDGSFVTASSFTPAGGYSGAAVDLYLPRSKFGGRNYFYVYNDGGNHFIGMGKDPVSPFNVCAASFNAGPGMSAIDAQNIDTKIDDGLPQSGRVLARGIYYYLIWSGASPGVATPASATTCYDNGNNAGSPMKYTAANLTEPKNCMMSFSLF